jgi:hypothetical protein
MFLGSKVRRVRKEDNLTTTTADCLENVGSLTSHNSIDLQDLLTGIAFFCEYYFNKRFS